MLLTLLKFSWLLSFCLLIMWASQGLNLRLPDYESGALINWATGPYLKTITANFPVTRPSIPSFRYRYFYLVWVIAISYLSLLWFLCFLKNQQIAVRVEPKFRIHWWLPQCVILNGYQLNGTIVDFLYFKINLPELNYHYAFNSSYWV